MGSPICKKLLGVSFLFGFLVLAAAALFCIFLGLAVTLVLAAAAVIVLIAAAVVILTAAAITLIIEIVNVLEIYRDLKILLEHTLKNDLSGNKSSNNGGNYDKSAPKTFTRAVFLFHFKNYLLSFFFIPAV